MSQTTTEEVKISSIIDDNVPKELQNKVAIKDGVLHISEDLLSHPHLRSNIGSFIMKVRRHGVRRCLYHPPGDFDKNYSADALRARTGGNALQNYAIKLIETAYQKRVSDIHIVNMGTYASIKMRTLGLLAEYEQLDADTGDKLVHLIYNTFGQVNENFSALKRLDGRIVDPAYLPHRVHSVRIHTEPIQSNSREAGSLMALRLLYDSTQASGTLDDRMSRLGFNQYQIETMHSLCKRGGLSLISGPTGHGKSTVLKHIMESMVENMPQKSYFSVEDPPEYPIRGICQIQVGADKGGNDTDSHLARSLAYADAIAGAMRSDPDIIMIGEIRYAESAVAAIDAALTGHGVWATMHASDAFAIVTRLESLLRQAHVDNPLDAICDSSVLTGLCYQRLIPVLCPKCKKALLSLSEKEREMTVPRDLFNRIQTVLGAKLDQIYVRGDGCEHCKFDGNIGLTVAAEVVELDHEMLKHLRASNKLLARKIWKRKPGSISYVEHALEKIGAGLVDPADAETRLGVPLDYSQTFYADVDE